MLFTCTTAFAASQTTVTTYNTDTSVSVVSTVTGVPKDTMVTYLASKENNLTEGIQEDEIMYIDQQTSDGTTPMKFSYSLTAPTGTTWPAREVISEVKYGSNDSTVATALSAPAIVEYYGIEFTVEGAKPGDVGATLSADYIGQGESKEVTVTVEDGYEIESITVGGDEVPAGTSTFNVLSNQAVVVVTVKPKDGTSVYLYTDVTAADGLEVYDTKTNTKLNVVTGIGYYVGGPVDSAAIQFGDYDIDGGHDDGVYAAADVDRNATSCYFAVQLASADSLKDVSATKAIVYKNDLPVESK